MAALNDRRILVLTTNFGTESDELTKPIAALREAGATVTVAATEPGVVKTLAGDRDPGPEVSVDTTYEQVRAADFDALVIPGGTLNADQLRTDVVKYLGERFEEDPEAITSTSNVIEGVTGRKDDIRKALVSLVETRQVIKEPRTGKGGGDCYRLPT